ncbi:MULTISPECIES: LysM peptidoglycan-binding domain-containing protein [Aerococcus]|uniref:LysM peptidoglycan-binding domain-containing protein n=1 Tax=Aerococcus tenax TaxID=3078812 RepID=A0A5N1BVS4_9LACT|nr:LysM peptidoglycan-binding domain-containing protein [Aerococcus urinae]KAA9241543.1 LysM peptidoglycan-binding domain-containing protein [Aerococcus urinae]MDK6370682.1 LysM peptidoglycan-binding domain-containing protein [Aerococcus urinae]MDK6596646.1 LysM peptidoglycan-binding domain-containing protein [Aerococcus urinae]MDK7302111.1 LysM peptidoglycan-binding domain-containing protein [Aerococcus urinae]MDK7800939.1 LysM peptidoglycan-binding domain-containing protein [Aerococcus urina
MKKTKKIMLGTSVLTSAALAAVIAPNVDAAEYTIKVGDTLSELALQFNTTIEELRDGNNIEDVNLIFAGETLDVPSAETPQASNKKEVKAEKPAPAPAAKATTSQTADANGVYTVVAGDTLNKIAAQFNTTAQAIRDLNGLQGDLILIGQQLQVKVALQERPAPVAEYQAAPQASVVEEEKLVTELPEVTANEGHVEENVSPVEAPAAPEVKEAQVGREAEVVETEVASPAPAKEVKVEEAVVNEADQAKEAAEQAQAQAAKEAEAQKAAQAQAQAEQAAKEAEAQKAAQAAKEAEAQKAAQAQAQAEQAAKEAEAQRAAQAAKEAEEQKAAQAAKQAEIEKAQLQAQTYQAANTQVQAQPVSTNNATVLSAYDGSVDPRGLAPAGQCTYYVINRLHALGKPVPGPMGNANQWAYTASNHGIPVSNTPTVGSVVSFPAGVAGASGYGHVAFVEGVNPDGSIRISEMNFGGSPNVTYRTVDAGSAAASSYIHF